MTALGATMIVVGLPSALLDMGMNGSRYAGWAPWGLAMAALGLLFVHM
jgi:hypothetical protein